VDAELQVRDVKRIETRSGNTRWVRRVAEDIREGDEPEPR
jgi:hypothetical protein